MRRPLLAGITLLVVISASENCYADGFSSAHTEAFKLNTPGRDLSVESLRISLNNSMASGGLGGGSGQANSNMDNVIQVTENYSMILNGNNNTMSMNAAATSINGQQTGNGVNQTANNQVQTNHDTTVQTTNQGASSSLVLNGH
jgi:hypothetical protein